MRKRTTAELVEYVRALACALAIACATTSTSAEPIDAAQCAGVLGETVAVGLDETASGGLKIVIAAPPTLPRSTDNRDVHWRLRTLYVSDGVRPDRIQLLSDGTALQLWYGSEPSRFDLTDGTDALDRRQPDARSGRNLTDEGLEVTAARFQEPFATLADLTQAAGTRCAAGQIERYTAALEDDAAAALSEAHFLSHPAEKSRQARPPATWGFHRVRRPDERLYAPILQLAPSDVPPSRFAIWNDLNTPTRPPIDAYRSKELRIREAQRRYAALGPERRTCAIHFHVVDGVYPGVWLYEYWLYYPFDAGAFEDHLHDSEHFFVEVDRLGGTVKRVIGAAHGPWTTNNIYDAARDNSLPVRLPLRAIVEFRKHATAPDVNADGTFTPGVDTNQYLDRAKVWGIRDTIGATDVNLRGFESSMPVRRRPEDAHTTRDFARLFRSGDTLAGAQSDCDLVGLPPPSHTDVTAKAACGGGHEATEGCAKAQVLEHLDWRKPSRILKNGVFPPFFVRSGVTLKQAATRSDNAYQRDPTAYVGLGLDLSKATFGRLALPGRLTVDVLLRDRLRYQWESPYTEHIVGIRDEGFGLAGLIVRYERPMTNLAASYLGVTWLADLRDPTDTVLTSGWLDAGMKLERAFGDRYSVEIGAGLTFHYYFGLDYEFRAGVGMRLPPVPGFGIKGRSALQ